MCRLKRVAKCPLYGIAGCPLLRGFEYIEVYGRHSGPAWKPTLCRRSIPVKNKLTTTYYYYIQNCPLAILQVSTVEGCLLSGVPLYWCWLLVGAVAAQTAQTAVRRSSVQGSSMLSANWILAMVSAHQTSFNLEWKQLMRMNPNKTKKPSSIYNYSYVTSSNKMDSCFNYN